MEFKVKIEIDGEWHEMDWNELHEAIAFGNDLTTNRKVFWTGLCDRNKKYIYERDLVKHNENVYVCGYSKNFGIVFVQMDKHLGDFPNTQIVTGIHNYRDYGQFANFSKYTDVIGTADDIEEILSSKK